MSGRQPGQLPPVPGFPPAESYAQYQWQRQQYAMQQQQHMATAAGKQPSQWKPMAMNMGMGFAMGMFVGGSVGLLHAVMSGGGINKVAVKRAAGGGLTFGVIFAVGSLIRPS